MKAMSLRTWVSVITAAFLILIIILARHEIVRAWELLGSVNLWILALLVPAQLIVYFAAGEMTFSYLRAKKADHHIKPAAQARMALEMNFVNHVLPSAGVSGISYMTWRLGKYGVSPGRATVAQLVRYVAGFVSFITLLVIAVVLVTIDGNINRFTILISGAIVTCMLGGTFGLIYLVSSKQRSEKFASWLARTVNRFVRTVTGGRRRVVVHPEPIQKFFEEMHQEYLTIRQERKVLIKPYLWGLLFNLMDVMLFVIAFWALGEAVNPAPVLVAYGLASLAGFILVTPGGAGAYEAIMVSFLATAGINPGVAIAGTILTRVIILLGTIGVGYFFYQHAIIKYGKSRS